MNSIIQGHALDVLRTLPSESVQMCATSPPYLGLRDYNCPPATFGDGWSGELGHEDTPDLFVAHLVEVFREVRRVLTPSGVLFVNMGDSYSGSGVNDGTKSPGLSKAAQRSSPETRPGATKRWSCPCKPKDLIGVPWLLAFALRADGWFLRSDIIWAKGVSFCPTYSGSCMPESTRDRPTCSHEHVFLLSKAQRYYYDADAVREGWADERGGDPGGGIASCEHRVSLGQPRRPTTAPKTSGRNLRNVWTINPKPYAGAHFAVWPPALVEPMVKAGSSERGCCPACSAPWERVVEKTRTLEAGRLAKGLGSTFNDACLSGRQARDGAEEASGLHSTLSSVTTGWRPTCDCPEHEPVPCTVLDPFAGSGTTGIVAVSLGRRFVGIDINGGDCDLGGHTAQQRVDAAGNGHSLEDELAGQLSLLGGLS